MLTSSLKLEFGRAVFTLATGKTIYLEMAFALARSFKLWHKNSSIRFFLGTDRDRSCLPSDLRDLELISIAPCQFGRGFEPKLNLDRIAPAQRSLFVDADCLCVGSLEASFMEFSGRAISVIGREIREGEWGGVDVGTVSRQFNIPGLIRFNGGIYYLERGPECTRVFETARSLLPQYDEIGFARLRGFPNEEVLLSLSMALHGAKPVPERGDIMNTLLAGPAGLEIDVFKGQALLRNTRNNPRRNPWYEMEELRPRIVHFLGTDLHTYPYWQEIRRLRLVEQRRWPLWLATLLVKVSFSFPWLLWLTVKQFLRPIFRAVCGYRAVGLSERG